jgi:hypothetical protein
VISKAFSFCHGVGWSWRYKIWLRGENKGYSLNLGLVKFWKERLGGEICGSISFVFLLLQSRYSIVSRSSLIDIKKFTKRLRSVYVLPVTFVEISRDMEECVKVHFSSSHITYKEEMFIYRCSLSPLQNFCTHVQEAGLGLAFWEESNGFTSLVDIIFSHGASLFDAVALYDKVVCLLIVSILCVINCKS